ncbi:MAG: Uma2 family endonuclease, partial [Spirochaetia bacterium]|nr:Uma2 family endonuclease [Spirochaetia bacterium]
DLVVEILSPSTLKMDLLYKLNKYLEAGVGEYWIIDPEEKTVSVNVLKDGRYVLFQYAAQAALRSAAIPGFTLEVKSIFPD